MKAVQLSDAYDSASRRRDCQALLLGGMALALLMVTVPSLRQFGYLLVSIAHELGHTIVAWFLGCPAYPAIRLNGHAASLHKPQVMLFCIGIMLTLSFAAWLHRDERGKMYFFVVSALLYPFLAFTPLREALHMLGGHVGELAIAAWLFACALRGKGRFFAVGRVLCTTLACFFVGRNYVMTTSLLMNEDMHNSYLVVGPLGIKNDYHLVAEDIFGVSLDTVVFTMLVLSAFVLPLTLQFSQRRGLSTQQLMAHDDEAVLSPIPSQDSVRRCAHVLGASVQITPHSRTHRGEAWACERSASVHDQV